MNVGLFLKGTSVQKFVFEDELNSQITDIELVCTDGKINAHKIILLSRSVHFQEALQRNPGTTSISFSTINRDGMKMVLRVIYGEVVKLPEGDPYKLLEALKFLKVNYWVQFEKFRLGLGSSDDTTMPTDYYPGSPTDMEAPSLSDDLSSRRSADGESAFTSAV